MTVEKKIDKKASATLKRRLRKKKRKLEKQDGQKTAEENGVAEASAKSEANGNASKIDGVEVEYVSAPRDFLLEDGKGEQKKEEENGADEMEEDDDGEMPMGGLGLGAAKIPKLEEEEPKQEASKGDAIKELNRIFDHFAPVEELLNEKGSKEDDSAPNDKQKEEGDKDDAENNKTVDSSDSDDSDDEESKMSKKKRKLKAQLKIAELKQICSRPEVVEVWDVTAADPRLLVFLKACRNTVPVPRHWSQKRKYLQGKRGIEKPAFKLPDYIEATGISMMRQAYQEKEEQKKLKQKQRDRMAPKLGKMDIDYTILHDAFFKYQTKPTLTRMGELYYEGKEFEARVKDIKPGILSEELRKSLGMADGAPPPWLINMQRYGPPPSYPSLKIAGLNAPIPPGASFGYHPGGWGKPPVDEEGDPLYGDVFGQYGNNSDSDHEVDKTTHWGDLDSEAEESSEEEEEEDEDEMEEDANVHALDDEALTTGTASIASGFASSLPSGIETPDMIDLRKATDKAQKQLYTVLEQKAANVDQGQILGSDHVYVMPGAEAGAKERWPIGAGDKRRMEMLQKSGTNVDVDVTLDPEELEGLDEDAIKQLYEQKLAAAREKAKVDDFSDMVAAKAREQKRKMAAKESAKKKDTFKF